LNSKFWSINKTLHGSTYTTLKARLFFYSLIFSSEAKRASFLQGYVLPANVLWYLVRFYQCLFQEQPQAKDTVVSVRNNGAEFPRIQMVKAQRFLNV